MIKAYYENSKGEILNLLSYPFLTAEADWFDAEWEDDVGGFIRTVQLDVFGKNEEDVSQNMEQLYRVLGADAEAGKFGKLYVNDTYQSVEEGHLEVIYCNRNRTVIYGRKVIMGDGGKQVILSADRSQCFRRLEFSV